MSEQIDISNNHLTIPPTILNLLFSGNLPKDCLEQVLEVFSRILNENYQLYEVSQDQVGAPVIVSESPLNYEFQLKQTAVGIALFFPTLNYYSPVDAFEFRLKVDVE